MEWIKCSERLPDSDDYVLLYDKSLSLVCEGKLKTEEFYRGKLKKAQFYYSDRCGFSKDVDNDCEITHWMPLPEAPKE